MASFTYAKLTENNIKYKQIIKYKHIKQIINKNIAIKTQKCIDKTRRWCYYKTIKKNKRKKETQSEKSEIHSIHSIDAHERMKKGKGDSSGNIIINFINMRVTGTGFPARKT